MTSLFAYSGKPLRDDHGKLLGCPDVRDGQVLLIKGYADGSISYSLLRDDVVAPGWAYAQLDYITLTLDEAHDEYIEYQRVFDAEAIPVPPRWDTVMARHVLGEMPTGPQLPGAYRTWRVWKVTDNDTRLWPLNPHQDPWHPGWNEIPDLNTVRGKQRNGFHGSYHFTNLLESMDHIGSWLQGKCVVGLTLFAGKMVKGSKGVRASRAKPEYLVLTGRFEVDAQLLSIADAYGMKAVSIGEAEQLPLGHIEDATE